MKIYHRPDIDFVSIDFNNELEASSFFQDGLLIRLDKKGHVIGLDITDSSQFFSGSDLISMQDACKLLKVSESTMRRWIREGKVPYSKPNGKDYRFKKSDVLKVAS